MTGLIVDGKATSLSYMIAFGTLLVAGLILGGIVDQRKRTPVVAREGQTPATRRRWRK